MALAAGGQRPQSEVSVLLRTVRDGTYHEVFRYPLRGSTAERRAIAVYILDVVKRCAKRIGLWVSSGSQVGNRRLATPYLLRGFEGLISISCRNGLTGEAKALYAYPDITRSVADVLDRLAAIFPAPPRSRYRAVPPESEREPVSSLLRPDGSYEVTYIVDNAIRSHLA